MRHAEAVGHLPDFALDALDESTRTKVATHVEQCADCQSWLATHGLMAAALMGPAEREHPESNVLAMCAARPGEEHECDREDVSRHLEACGRCRDDLELMRDALRAARPAVDRVATAVVPNPISYWWKIAAAGIVGLAIVSLFTFGPWRDGTYTPEPIESSTGSDMSFDAEWNSGPEIVSGTEIGGSRIIEAEGALTITKVKIKHGARVTIRAGEVVAFGDGFQIGPGTRVTVGVGSRNDIRKDDPS